jgi:cation transport ATPase
MRDMLLDLPSLWVPHSGVSHRAGESHPEDVVQHMTDIKPILFLFLAGVIDIAVTLLVLFMDWGTESTIYYNWISPMWLMCLYMIVVNLVFCLALLHFTNHLSKNMEIFGIRAAIVVLSASLYVFGFARLYFGAGTGILITLEMMGI